MEIKQSKLLDIYYDLYDITEDIDLLADAIKELTDCKMTRSYTKQNLVFTRLWNLESALLYLNDNRDVLVLFVRGIK